MFLTLAYPLKAPVLLPQGILLWELRGNTEEKGGQPRLVAERAIGIRLRYDWLMLSGHGLSEEQEEQHRECVQGREWRRDGLPWGGSGRKHSEAGTHSGTHHTLDFCRGCVWGSQAPFLVKASGLHGCRAVPGTILVGFASFNPPRA